MRISVTNPLSPGPPAVANGEIGYSTIEFNVEPATLGSSYVSQLDNATSAMRDVGVQVQYGGGLDQLTRPKPHDMRSELLGFAMALVMLLAIFAIVFGLSMDYEVFLLSRVKEAWDRTRDHHKAVAEGLATAARVISCAALVMIAVFIFYVTSTNVVIKQLAVGLAASVLIDATIVRLILVPSVMYLLGNASWWLPRWLGRALPHIDVEGVPDPLALTATPAAAAPFSTGLTLHVPADQAS
ncbi:MAG TPA: MMPL family transporter [Acidimicrobiales bacterium]|nr:MMPL family transporter [Acidimicrobiales bacterium]